MVAAIMFTILHLIPTLEGGGAERQLSMLASEQSSRGWCVHVGIRRGGVHEESLRSSGVVVHFLGDHKAINPKLLVRISALIKQIKPDVVQTWLPQMDIAGGIASLWNKVPWVVSERTSRLSFPGISVNSWARIVLARYASAVVANSSNGAAYWSRLLPFDARVFRVANAVDVAAIRNATFVNMQSSNLRLCKKFVLVVGRLSAEKAVETIVKAVSLMPLTFGVKVLIVGEGPLREEIETSIVNAGVEELVSLLPYREDWWGLLKNASALISMSRVEGQPNVVLETMAAGCPLIVSDIPAHREILTPDSAIFVQLADSVELAASIQNLLSDSESARKRAERARNYVDGLTIQRAADAYESVFANVCSKKGGA